MGIWNIPIFITTGLISGFLAGLFGIGGGVILVPAFWIIFSHLGIPESEAIKLSIGTSLAIITIITLFTSGTHLLKGNLNLKEIGWLLIWILGGVGIGIYLSHVLPGKLLKKFFALLLIITSIKHFKKNELTKKKNLLNENLILPLTVFSSALLSALLGIGGGVIVNSSLFSFTNRDVTKIVALSSTVSFLNALFGSIGYLLVKPETQIPYQIGYVYVPAAIFVSLGALVGSKIGLNVLYRVEGKNLKRWFALLLLVIAIRILIS
ncbi:Uncharacterized membrane protein YfcA [Desulfurobacterium pacificum]|uniref:Probable membrane transporter protein n=1 Tax=Desulfurobacterium pacificum TaxID=240166 RepID=A0ABY1NR11_9BACT|nr:sulfite exporter TauE/SafE family protein [Desulfurobacterium pacificum]SMP15102.1 Uncharacterized membrane protein YfcA [Desulfurobacterium pacificum]